jgi:hypothetical protein
LTATPTATPAPTDTPPPTATPRPQFNPDLFVFPYDMAQVIAQRSQIPYTDPFFVYHLIFAQIQPISIPFMQIDGISIPNPQLSPGN